MKSYYLIMLIAIFTAFSCSDKEDEEPDNNDPLMGMWQLIALEQNEQRVDITNQACLKDSHLDVTQTVMSLSLSAPQTEGSSSCQTESLDVEWVNDQGTYYTIEDGEREPAIFTLAPNNELSVDIILEETPLSLIFSK